MRCADDTCGGERTASLRVCASASNKDVAGTHAVCTTQPSRAPPSTSHWPSPSSSLAPPFLLLLAEAAKQTSPCSIHPTQRQRQHLLLLASSRGPLFACPPEGLILTTARRALAQRHAQEEHSIASTTPISHAHRHNTPRGKETTPESDRIGSGSAAVSAVHPERQSPVVPWPPGRSPSGRPAGQSRPSRAGSFPFLNFPSPGVPPPPRSEQPTPPRAHSTSRLQLLLIPGRCEAKLCL
jgi:hypothetical protein